MIATIHSAYLALILKSADALGLAVGPQRSQLGLDDALATEGRVPVQTTYQLWSAIAALSGDPAVGLRLADRALQFAAGALEYAARNCDTVGALLETIAQYARLLNTGAEITVEAQPSGVVLGYRLLAQQSVHPASTDFAIAYLLLRARALSGRRLMPTRLALPQPVPVDPDPYHALFGKQLRWQQPCVRVLFSQAQWDMALQTPDPELGRLMRQVVEREIDQLPPEDDLLTRVQVEVLRGGGRASRSIDDIAQRLGMTARTLQRRLSDAGTSFRALSNEARLGRAAVLVRDGLLPFDEVAYEVGFSDASTFYRAFRKAFGMTPTEYRAAAEG